MLRGLDSYDLERLVKDYLAPGIRKILREEMENANVDRKAVNRLDDKLSLSISDMGRLRGRIESLEEMVKGQGGAEIVRLLLGDKKCQ